MSKGCEREKMDVIDSPEAFARVLESKRRVLTEDDMAELRDGHGLPFDYADGEIYVLTPVPSHGKPCEKKWRWGFRKYQDACCCINREKQQKRTNNELHTRNASESP